MTTVTIDHVTKYFYDNAGTRTIATDNIHSKLTKGDLLAILGPSGCGKSTLLRLVAGLTQPDKGKILYDNVPLDDVPLQDRGIGMVFQDGALIPHWEARRSIDFYLRLRKRQHEVPERVKHISKITGFGLDQLLDRRPRQLSGGEQQRVSIARALTRDRRVMLFDEPFANLDAKYRTEARVELRRLLNEFPVTSIYVTHDQVEAIALADRIAIMNEGKFEQIGTYRSLYDSPINLFVATFIGIPAINTFKGRVQDGQWIGKNFGGFPIRNDLPNDTQVTVGIRPQHLYLDNDGVAGVVENITPMLAERYQLIDVWLGAERWSLALPLDIKIEWGSTIYCKFNPDEILYFDTQTGVRIG